MEALDVGNQEPNSSGAQLPALTPTKTACRLRCADGHSVGPGYRGLRLDRPIQPLVALAFFLTAYDFEPGRLTDLPSIVGDAEAAATLRWAGLADMLAYLPVAPMVIYLHRRLAERAPELIGVLTFGGLAYVLLGSLGGTLFATVGPPLVADGSEAARVVFAAFADVVTITLGGTLEIGFGVWLIGVGWLLRRDSAALGYFGVVAGIGSLLSAARTGSPGGPSATCRGCSISQWLGCSASRYRGSRGLVFGCGGAMSLLQRGAERRLEPRSARQKSAQRDSKHGMHACLVSEDTGTAEQWWPRSAASVGMDLVHARHDGPQQQILELRRDESADQPVATETIERDPE